MNKSSGMDMKNMDMMKDMSNQCQMMSENFSDLGDHFQEMMKIDDINELKVAMQKHHGMMQQMHNSMNEHGKMCQNMVTMMNDSDMSGHSNVQDGVVDHTVHNH